MTSTSSFSDPKDIKLLLQACQQLGLDPSTIECENPHLKSGKVAEGLQMAMSALNPQRGAQLAKDAGKKPSLASVSAMMGLSEMTREVHENLVAVDPDYISGLATQAEDQERLMLERMTREADELHLRNLRIQHGDNAERVFEAEKEAESAQAAAQANGEVSFNYQQRNFR